MLMPDPFLYEGVTVVYSCPYEGGIAIPMATPV